MKILDVLCLVFGCASGFAWYRSLSPPFTDAFRPLGQCYNVVMGVVLGLLLTGGFRLFRSCRWGVSAVPPQPGHWLLGFGLAAILACAGAVGAYHGLILHGGGPETYAMFGPPYWVPIHVAWYPTSFGMMHQGVGWSLGTAAALAFSWASFGRLPWRWWVLFPVITLGASVLAVGHITAFIDLWGRPATRSWCVRSVNVYCVLVVACLLIIASASGRDAWEGRRGDALHRTGVSAWLLIGAIQLVVYFWCLLNL